VFLDPKDMEDWEQFRKQRSKANVPRVPAPNPQVMLLQPGLNNPYFETLSLPEPPTTGMDNMEWGDVDWTVSHIQY
jgi:hypothetical protein